jgi:hypothetical protein
MTVITVRSRDVCWPYIPLWIGLGYRTFTIGICAETWGVRLCLGFWHVCIHWNLKEQG